jgi:riboflavin synthase
VFTGIIETAGTITELINEGSNLHIWVTSTLSNELRIDQSVAHNGVCLTVVDLGVNSHKVTAVAETLSKTNLSQWKLGDKVNIERCMPANGRFDGHIVQGHVDNTALCTKVEELDGSWLFYFEMDSLKESELVVNKGSICINGVSLTVVAVEGKSFYVTIIPYTYEFTNFNQLKAGMRVNLEYDILGKYIQKQLAARA